MAPRSPTATLTATPRSSRLSVIVITESVDFDGAKVSSSAQPYIYSAGVSHGSVIWHGNKSVEWYFDPQIVSYRVCMSSGNLTRKTHGHYCRNGVLRRQDMDGWKKRVRRTAKDNVPKQAGVCNIGFAWLGNPDR